MCNIHSSNRSNKLYPKLDRRVLSDSYNIQVGPTLAMTTNEIIRNVYSEVNIRVRLVLIHQYICLQLQQAIFTYERQHWQEMLYWSLAVP